MDIVSFIIERVDIILVKKDCAWWLIQFLSNRVHTYICFRISIYLIQEIPGTCIAFEKSDPYPGFLALSHLQVSARPGYPAGFCP